MPDDLKDRIAQELALLADIFPGQMRELCARHGWPPPEVPDRYTARVTAPLPGGARRVEVRPSGDMFVRLEMPSAVTYRTAAAPGPETARWLLRRNAERYMGYWGLRAAGDRFCLTFVMQKEFPAGLDYDFLGEMVEYMDRECREVEKYVASDSTD